MNQNFVSRIKQIQAEALASHVKKNDESQLPILSIIHGVIQDLKFADTAISFTQLNEGFHIIYANSISLRLLIFSNSSFISIHQVDSHQNKEIYRGEHNEKEILTSVENALVKWYQSLFKTIPQK